MSSLKLDVVRTDSAVTVSFSGQIDEKFFAEQSQALFNVPKDASLVFNLQNLKAINSSGIRDWIKAMQFFQASKVFFANCPKAFIDQVNMVAGFIPRNSQVISFYVPYFNEEKEEEILVLFKFGQEYSATHLKVPPVHEKDGVQYELDVIEAKYFKFLKG